MDIKAFIIGGLLPTIALGVSTVLMKMSMKAGASISVYLAEVGATVCGLGLAGLWLTGQNLGTARSAAFSVAMGIAWSVAVCAMAYGVSNLKMPVSIIAPLTNSNALIAIILSAILFREWENLDMLRVVAGAILIIIGVSVLATAQR